MVHAAYQSHLGQDYFFAPRARLADGIIWLLIVKAGITRANLLHVSYVPAWKDSERGKNYYSVKRIC